ncbi:MAG TPA: hypothetical protein VHS80_12200 [Chthoniobacterales bacterium]|nr:hypothetical protein [Chthoniobacterales bacterium]
MSNQQMSEKQIVARVRDIKQEDIGIFRVELVAEALPDPRGFEVVCHPIQFKLATRKWVMNHSLNLWGIGVPNVCPGQEIQLTIRRKAKERKRKPKNQDLLLP